MEKKYRESLRIAKLSELESLSLYQSNWSYPVEPEAVSVLEEAPELNDQAIVTEKTKVLDSLNVFGENKLKGSDEFKFDGGKFLPKTQNISDVNLLEIDELLDLNAIQECYGDLLHPDDYSKKFHSNFSKSSEGLKVHFITDDLLDDEIKKEQQPTCELGDMESELAPYFDMSVSELFVRMIKAMGLRNDQIYISSFKIKAQHNNKILLSEILYFNPDLIITLGAQATNGLLLKSKERLKDIHGKIIDIQVRSNQPEVEQKFKMLPLFSPKLLQTSPNMKKMAWEDMQVAMKLLNL